MNPGPQKPSIQRPPALSSPEVSSVRLGRISKPLPVSKTGLLISLGIHACLIAAACFITFRTFGEKGTGDDDTAGDHGDFQMMMSSREPLAGNPEPVPPTVPQPLPPALPQIPVIAVRDLPAIQALPPIEKATAVTAEKHPASPSPATASSGKSSSSSSSGAAKAGGKKGSGSGRQTKAEPPAAPPKLISAPPPRYPASARSAKKEGKVGVLVRVRANGSAASTSVYHSSGNAELDQAAVEAARSWKFSQTPSLGPGATIAVVVSVTFDL